MASTAGGSSLDDGDFMEFATRASRGAPGGPAEYAYEYLLVVARKGAGHEPD